MVKRPRQSGPDILIVEDESFLRRMCVLHLQKPDRMIRTAQNGQEAMEMLRKKQPDILLLDLLLPKVDGFSVLEFIQEQQWSFPILVLSNIEWEFDRKGSEVIGATEYIVKSGVDIETIVEKVEKHLAARTEK